MVRNIVELGQRRTEEHSWVSKTRATVWHGLEKNKRIDVGPEIPAQDDDPAKKLKLEQLLGQVDPSGWTKETGMYDSLSSPIQQFLTETGSPFSAVQTHQSSLFAADLSFSRYSDERLLHGLHYFAQWKPLGVTLDSPEHCRQLVDYFNQIQRVQRFRSTFICTLSNYDSAWIFIATYGGNGILMLFSTPIGTPSKQIPELDQRIAPIDDKYTILDVSRCCFLLSLPMPSVTPGSQKGGAWQAPCRHLGNSFVLKIRHDGGADLIQQEIDILWKLTDAQSKNIPELVWTPDSQPQYGIVPVGRAIDFGQSARVSRKIVEGLLDGLEYLHGQGVVHRDIRPSNLVLDKLDNVIIIDYETALTIPRETQEEYFGGYICWPERQLVSTSPLYSPEPSDDLLASILVVLHLLFPSPFNMFRVTRVTNTQLGGQKTAETKKLLELWKAIKDSKVWGRFVNAAEAKNYDDLREMGQVFCHI